MTSNLWLEIQDSEIAARKRDHKRLKAKDLVGLVTKGEVFGPVRFENSLNGYPILAGKGFYCRFRKGDSICLGLRLSGQAHAELLKTKGGRDRQFDITQVTFDSKGSVAITLGNKRADLDTNLEYYVFPHYDPGLDIKMRGLLQDQVSSERIVETISPKQAITLNVGSLKAELNETQKMALRFILDRGMTGAVQGPPGTGKTQLLNALVEVANIRGMTVGICAFTHKAVDNALSRISLCFPQTPITRIGKLQRISSELYLPSNSKLSFCEKFSEAGACHVFGATAHAWAFSKDAPQVDVMLIDEAGQLASTFLPLVALKTKRIIALGDPKQLPPVMTLRQFEGQDIDAFSSVSKIMKEKPSILNTQYRMNSNIQTWSSKRYYAGDLKAHESVFSRDVVASSLSVGEKSVQYRDDANQPRAIIDLVQDLNRDGGVPLSQIGVICPHRVEVGEILKQAFQQLAEEEAKNIQVDTVERFQGQEREVIIFGVSNKEKMSAEELAFLNDPRRINVAVTRARSRFYFFEKDPTKQNEESEISAFAKWCKQGSE